MEFDAHFKLGWSKSWPGSVMALGIKLVLGLVLAIQHSTVSGFS